MKRVIVDYIRQNISRLVCFLLVCLAFSVYTVLYGLPAVAALYPFLMSLVFFSVDFVGKFIITYKRHNEYKKAAAGIMTAAFSTERVGVEEKDLIELNNKLIEQLKAIEAQSSSRYDEMVQYYTVWAHQIKTPIASMKLVLQSMDSSEARRLRSMLTRIEQYVEMVLVYVRLESRDSDYVFKSTDVYAVTRNAVKRFSGDFIMKKLSVDIQPFETVCVCDEKWLSFVIEQIISNSLKYTENGGISIYSEEQMLCIRDTGIGIAAEDLPRIFEKGYTGYNGRTGESSTGLGLYLCHMIAQKLGFTITAESEIGEGTVIKLDLSQTKRVFE